ncbi:putative sodium-dependent phosphate transporter [Schistosoma mansoni]|uniref:putative sodium-dependent phosphate transporter n=1 Tax=Schistosoma mansoni TaxID=6183 RepID=UPI0001A622B6|nr:putative sodium-dependent phosphate transporter [Schistosoma mansoni]|eukprot:XP_018653853.1 putative sodium-dependent phosphate transporter [Schistosoma mansoni]
MWSRAERHKWMSLLFIGAVGLYASRAVMPITSVAIASELNWNRKEMGFMMGIFFWGYAVTQYLGGYLSDVFGGEIVIAISSLGWSILTVCFIWLPSINLGSNDIYGLFIITRFLLGIFQGFYYPSLASLMANRVQVSNRNITFAVITAGTHLGTILCGSLGSYLAENDGWRTPFFWIGILFFAWSFIVYLIVTQSKFVYINPKSVDNDSLSSVPLRPLNWSLLFRHKPFWVMLLANFVHNNTFYIILNWCPSYFHDNYPDARSWVFNMVPWLIIFPSVLLAGALADHWMKAGVSVTIVRKIITTIVLLGSSLFLIILSSLDNYYGSLICMAFALACLGFHCSGVLLNPQDMAPNHSGQLYGIMATVGTFPGFAGVYMVGYILEATNQWSVIFIMTALISIVGWVGYVLYGSSEILF